jgi:hypothetical protein
MGSLNCRLGLITSELPSHLTRPSLEHMILTLKAIPPDIPERRPQLG